MRLRNRLEAFVMLFVRLVMPFVKDKRAVQITAKLEALIVAFLWLTFGLALGGSVVTTVQAVNTTGWTFTGYQAVESIIDMFPLIYYAGIILGFLGIIFFAVKMGGKVKAG